MMKFRCCGGAVLLLALFAGPLSGEKARASLSALPSCVRLNPVTGKIFEDRPDLYRMKPLGGLLSRNWVYDGKEVRICSARNGYAAFQAVLKSNVPQVREIRFSMGRFRRASDSLQNLPELFQEWFVQVKTPSTHYEKSSLGPGWYPDALISLNPSANVPGAGAGDHRGGRRNRSYPLEIPDFRNRVDGQRYLVVYVEQFIPFERVLAPGGTYVSELMAVIGTDTLRLPVSLTVWDFSLPQENHLACNGQHGGLANLDTLEELRLYQYFKRHRFVPVEEGSGYWPDFRIKDGRVAFDWTRFDKRLGKYLTGRAFTGECGYFGPGYGEPLEILLLPFTVPGGRSRDHWSRLDTVSQETTAAYRSFYGDAVNKVREHMLRAADTAKTRLIVFLSAFDETDSEEARSRLLYYGRIFKERFPEALFRVDGSFSRESMEALRDVVDIWCCHAADYDPETVGAFRRQGMVDWFYGPLLYERWENGWSGSMTFLDLELGQLRAASWIAWKYGARSWATWGLFAGFRAAWFNPETQKNYYDEEKDLGPVLRLFNGNAQMVYSGGILNPWSPFAPALRLKALREGEEEYEMLRLLTEFSGGAREADSLASVLVPGKPLGRKSYGRLNEWSHDPGAWDRARIRMGERIEALIKTGKE